MKMPFPTLARTALACSALLASLASAFATDFFATPDGAGSLDGSSWADASPQAEIQTLLDGLQPGDTLNLGSGTYAVSTLSLAGAGTETDRIQLIGVDTGGGYPVFQGTFNVAVVSGGSFLVLPTEAHYWTIKNLTIRNHRFPVSLVQSGTTYERYTHLLFENIACDSLEDAFRLYNASNLTLKNCSAVRFTKKAFRISDYSRDIVLDGCFTDCTGGDPDFPARSIPNGFFCDDTGGAPIIHDITFVDCTAINTTFPQSSGSYWNGDGFSSERGAYNLLFLRCKAYDNVDGGFDNKAENVTYQDCVASGNKRGFRHWGAGAVMNNCVSVNNYSTGGTGGANGLWVSGNGGSITISFSTFHNATGGQIYVESGGAATIADSILSTDTSSAFTTGPVTLSNTVTYRPGEGVDPAYVAPSASWRGTPADSMDSQTYGATKGYNSDTAGSINTPPTVSINATPTGGNAPLPVNFTATASDTDGTIVSYYWTFGDGQGSIQQNASVTYGLPGTYTATCTVTDNRGGQASDAVEISVTAPTVPVPIRIESGGTSSYTDGSANVWGADHSYGPGGGIADRGAIAIANTTEDRIYQTERWGVSDYALVLANGTYTVNLHFAETYAGITGPGQRLFTVTANETIPAGWSDIDVFAQAGGNNTALVKSGTVAITDNMLTLEFAASADNTMISGIEILPVSGGDLPPTVPTGVAAHNLGMTSFDLTWNASGDDIDVAGYEVFLDGISHGVFAGTSASLSGLTQFATYSVTLRARDTAGNASAPSAPLSVTTEADPSAPFELVMDNTDPAGVLITGSWTGSTSSSGYYGTNYIHDENTGKGTKSVRFTPVIPVATAVEVFVRWTAGTNRATNVPIDIIHSAGTTIVSVNQQQNHGVWVSVGTYPFDAGNSGSVLLRTTSTNGFVMADAVRFVKAEPDTEAPTIPSGLAASGITSNGFTLTWTPSTDDTGVAGYEVFLDGVSYAAPTGASVNVTGRTAETTYSVTVTAIDAAENQSAQSAPLAVTTTEAPPTEPGEGSIGVNLTDAANALAAGDIVGVVPAAHWNNSTENNEVLTNVIDSQGVATTADLTFGNTAFLYTNNTPAHADPMTDDAKMMRTQRGRSNQSTTSVTAAQVPYSAYDVYIYWGGRSSGESVPVVMTVGFQLWDGSAWITQEAKYIRDTDRTWSGTYSESTATSAAEAVNGHDYVVFRNVTANTFRVTTAAANRVGLSGLQIVAQGGGSGGSGAEPNGPAPVISSASSATGTYGAPFDYAILASETPGSYSATGLPAGLALDPVSGIISGVPEVAGQFTLALSATNAAGTGTASLLLDIARAPQSIAFASPGSKTFRDPAFALAAHASSGLPVVYTLASGPATLDGNLVTLTGAGTVVITATQPGGANFLAAEPVSASLEVAPASVELALGGLWQLYDGQPKPVAVATTPADLAVEVTYNGSATPPVYPGSYAIEAIATDPNYTGSSSDTLVISTNIVVRHAPTLNGDVQGSIQVLSAEAVTLNGASIAGDLLLPGTPAAQLNGRPTLGATLDGPGHAQPANFAITLNGNTTLRHLVRRIDSTTLPVVNPPPAPTGTRDVDVNNATQSAGDFATLRNLTLNGNAGLRAIPPGTYGSLIANGAGGFILGVAGSTEPAVYNLRSLTLNGTTQVRIVGPVVLTLASGGNLNGRIGGAGEPELLLLRIASGGLTLNGGATLDGFVDAPNGTVVINGNSTLTGGIASDRLIVNGGGVLIGDSL